MKIFFNYNSNKVIAVYFLFLATFFILSFIYLLNQNNFPNKSENYLTVNRLTKGSPCGITHYDEVKFLSSKPYQLEINSNLKVDALELNNNKILAQNSIAIPKGDNNLKAELIQIAYSSNPFYSSDYIVKNWNFEFNKDTNWIILDDRIVIFPNNYQFNYSTLTILIIFIVTISLYLLYGFKISLILLLTILIFNYNYLLALFILLPFTKLNFIFNYKKEQRVEPKNIIYIKSILMTLILSTILFINQQYLPRHELLDYIPTSLIKSHSIIQFCMSFVLTIIFCFLLSIINCKKFKNRLVYHIFIFSITFFLLVIVDNFFLVVGQSIFSVGYNNYYIPYTQNIMNYTLNFINIPDSINLLINLIKILLLVFNGFILLSYFKSKNIHKL